MTALKTDTDLIPTACRQGNAVIASLSGEIDLHTSSELRDALLEMLRKYTPKKLILNLERVPYMDSSALAVLVESLKKIQRIGGRLFLIHPQPRVLGLLEIARLDTLFSMARDEQDAINR